MAQPVPPPRRDRSRSRSRHSYEGFVEKRGPRDQVGPGTEPRHPPGPSPGTHRHPPGTDPPPQSPPPPGAGSRWRSRVPSRSRRATGGSGPGCGGSRSPSTGDPGTARVPSCFFEVTRPEAERLLERSADGGNMVLRPGGHGRGVSVTTRREVNGTVQVKHYKVNRVDQGYVIDVDTPHRCSSLAEVVQYFVESSKGSLQPLHREYSPRLGERDPQSSAPHPAPRRALQPPHNHDVAEELAKKLQLRRALTGD
ncbi:signal-transducing adaptor protein 2 isoform X5 [Aquila chrysaetos chrysaetos]|uniref:signal-transducing adaptor protein 2 isoform X5 n=1 Tax=Aquila chrysaetos chrysaetos TaxID=223781 RepID=UPI0011769B52|nr:signal-transducing adaptor protein 2 isoform X5 [Aquila chrysaetos chrysaetos]